MNIRENYQKFFLVWEFVFCTLAAGLFGLFAFRWPWFQSFVLLDKDTRKDLYGVASSIDGALLGFIITGITILLALSEHPKLKNIKEFTCYQMVYTIFVNTVRWLIAAIVIGLFCLIYDRGKTPNFWLLTIAFWLNLLVVARVARCIWILENLIKIITKHEGPTRKHAEELPEETLNNQN